MIRGYTLLEVIISIALLSMCVIGFLQSLNVSMLGTDRVRQTNYAVELTRSQMEYIQQQEFILHNHSEPSKYGNVSELPAGWDTSRISTTIYNVTDANGSPVDHRVLQEVVVNVTYGGGRHLELRDYKSPREGSFVTSGSAGWLVTETINLPMIPCAPLGTKWGYYYTFKTGTTTGESGSISVMWQFETWGLKGVRMYLYGPDGREQFPTAKSGLIRQAAPANGLITQVNSVWGRGREICAIESDALAPGEYTVYYYNSGLSVLGVLVCLLAVPPSMSTITYIK